MGIVHHPRQKIETYEKEEEGEISFHISRSQDRVMHGKRRVFHHLRRQNERREKNVGGKREREKKGCEEKDEKSKEKQDKTKSNHKDADNVTTTTVTKNDKHFIMLNSLLYLFLC